MSKHLLISHAPAGLAFCIPKDTSTVLWYFSDLKGFNSKLARRQRRNVQRQWAPTMVGRRERHLIVNGVARKHAKLKNEKNQSKDPVRNGITNARMKQKVGKYRGINDTREIYNMLWV